MNENKLPARIKDLRKRLSLSQSSFANNIGTTQAAVSAWEVGDRLPSTEMLLAISEKYNISVDWLLGLSDTMYLSGEITRYPELLKLLVSICTVKDNNQIPLASLTSHNGAGEIKEVFLTFTDDTVDHFLQEWKKIFDLYSEGTIDRDIYEIWLQKHYDINDKILDTTKPEWA